MSERSLHSLELLNDLHHYNDHSDSLRAAYCAIAVECTACFLRSRPADDYGEFFDAVNRIWNCRVADLERTEEAIGLVSDGLKRVRKEMEEAVVDSRVRDALKRRDTKKEALEAVRVYLKEKSAKMGPAFLELVAEAIRGSRSSGVDPPSVELKEKGSGFLAKEEVGNDDDDDNTRHDNDNEMVSRPDVENPNATHVQVSKGKGKIGDLGGMTSKDDAIANSSGSGSKDEATKNHGKVQKRSIMDWNPTTRAYEWEEDSDSSSSESQSLTRKPHLPSSKKGVVSSLKVQRSRNLVGRRKKLRWTTVEEDTLRKAVEKYGKRNWKLIKSCRPDIFEDRTEVDLKDKWRNMTKP
ncbi:Myb domain-containing protein [Dioscorea alata]|uniref:Myb domain-containing protein n=1 Tax=Dioscorea alata TaxID=55571 RepID=A0ACB7UHA0_DIOAL|nr:Myb domain-containing protein [Dioscorea alata]